MRHLHAAAQWELHCSPGVAWQHAARGWSLGTGPHFPDWGPCCAGEHGRDRWRTSEASFGPRWPPGGHRGCWHPGSLLLWLLLWCRQRSVSQSCQHRSMALFWFCEAERSIRLNWWMQKIELNFGGRGRLQYIPNPWCLWSVTSVTWGCCVVNPPVPCLVTSAGWNPACRFPCLGPGQLKSYWSNRFQKHVFNSDWLQHPLC